MLHPPLDTSGEIIHIILIFTHFFSRRIGDFGHIHAVAGGRLHNDVQRLLTGIVGNVGADTESHGDAVFEGLSQLIGAVKIQAVAEQQCFDLRIDPERLIMCDHLLSPGEGISAVMAHTGEQGRIGQLEIFQETIRGNGIGQGNSV